MEAEAQAATPELKRRRSALEAVCAEAEEELKGAVSLRLVEGELGSVSGLEPDSWVVECAAADTSGGAAATAGASAMDGGLACAHSVLKHTTVVCVRSCVGMVVQQRHAPCSLLSSLCMCWCRRRPPRHCGGGRWGGRCLWCCQRSALAAAPRVRAVGLPALATRAHLLLQRPRLQPPVWPGSSAAFPGELPGCRD